MNDLGFSYGQVKPGTGTVAQRCAYLQASKRLRARWWAHYRVAVARLAGRTPDFRDIQTLQLPLEAVAEQSRTRRDV